MCHIMQGRVSQARQAFEVCVSVRVKAMKWPGGMRPSTDTHLPTKLQLHMLSNLMYTNAALPAYPAKYRCQLVSTVASTL